MIVKFAAAVNDAGVMVVLVGVVVDVTFVAVDVLGAVVVDAVEAVAGVVPATAVVAIIAARNDYTVAPSATCECAGSHPLPRPCGGIRRAGFGRSYSLDYRGRFMGICRSRPCIGAGASYRVPPARSIRP